MEYYGRNDLKRAIKRFENVKKIALKLKELDIRIGQPFRVKQLGNTITHSGTLFMQLVNSGVLKVVEVRKEVCPYINRGVETVTSYKRITDGCIISAEMYHDMNWRGRDKYIGCQKSFKPAMSKYNVYAIQENWRGILVKEIKELQGAVTNIIARETKWFVNSVQELTTFFKNDEWSLRREIRRIENC